MAEYRISIYGRKQSEWDQMASWIVNNELYSENVVWLIQVRINMFLKSHHGCYEILVMQNFLFGIKCNGCFPLLSHLYMHVFMCVQMCVCILL